MGSRGTTEVVPSHKTMCETSSESLTALHKAKAKIKAATFVAAFVLFLFAVAEGS